MRTSIHSLQVADVLVRFIEDEALPGTTTFVHVEPSRVTSDAASTLD